MQQRRWLITIALLLTVVRPAAAQMNSNPPTGSNIAPQARLWATDSDFGAGYTGCSALDGVVSGTSKWVSWNTTPTHWLAIDLGANRTVNGYVVRHASAGGEGTAYNTKSFSVQSGTSMSGPWTDEAVVDNSAQSGVTTLSYVTPKPLRYVRLYVTNPGSDNYVRIPEFEVWGASDGIFPDTPVGSNCATQAVQWATDSDYSSSYNGAKAIDGVTSGTSKWVSTGPAGPHWLALDLGSSRAVNGFIVRHAGAEGEASYYNAKALSFQSAPSMIGPWTDEIAIDNSAQANISSAAYATPKTLRYVRLYITNAGIDNYARIPEFEVLTSSVDSIPAAAAVMSGPVSVSDKIVSAVFTDCFFVEEPNRCAAIRCVASGVTLKPGDHVSIGGNAVSTNGEPTISPASYTLLKQGGPLRPLAMTGRSIASAKPSAIGLYTRTVGTVKAIGSGYFVIDDGGGLVSNRGVSGLEVRCYGNPVQVGDCVTVEGVLCRELANGSAAVVLRAVQPDGIRIVKRPGQITLHVPFDKGQRWGISTYDNHNVWQSYDDKKYAIDWLISVPGTITPNCPFWTQDGDNSLGKNLHAMHDGRIEVRWDNADGYGACLIIRGTENPSYLTLYAHLNSIDPSMVVGKSVKAGDIIGTVGKSGSGAGPISHLHMEIFKDNAGAFVPQDVTLFCLDGQAIDFNNWQCGSYDGRALRAE